MRQRIFAATLVLAALPALASAPGPAPEAPIRVGVLRGSECLDPTLVRGFHSLDRNQVIVDAGRHFYRIEVASSCWNLRFASVIAFRGDIVSGRVCGTPHDEILVRGEPPCRIQAMSLMTKDEYKQLQLERAAERKARREAAKKKQG
jgi:hypothetical protein